MTITMASRSITSACLRRSITVKPHQSLRIFPEFSRNASLPHKRRLQPRNFIQQRRAFSVAPARRFADVEENFDPKSIDRESDEVDVCIVGGGESNNPYDAIDSDDVKVLLDLVLLFD